MPSDVGMKRSENLRQPRPSRCLTLAARPLQTLAMNPIFQDIQSLLMKAILDHHKDGDRLPSMRWLAGELGVNALTVAKAYHPLLERGVIRAAHGIDLFVAPGGVEQLRQMERAKFLSDTWPEFRARATKLGVDLHQLLEELDSSCQRRHIAQLGSSGRSRLSAW
jgi:GntR family transcriptional regulator